MPYDLREIFALFLIFIPLERALPLRPEQKLLRHRWLDDLAYLFLNPFLIAAIYAFLLAVLLAPLQALVPAAVTKNVASLPLWAQVPLILLVAEVGFYSTHRLFHAVPALWRLHAVHHSIEDLDWLAAHRIHPFDIVATNIASVLPLLLLGFSNTAIVIWAMTYFVQTHLIHSNVRLRFGWLEHVLASPHYHHWHHGRDARPANFGAQLVFMDQLFGTLLRPEGMPARYGISDHVPALFPLALLSPFQPRRQEPAE